MDKYRHNRFTGVPCTVLPVKSKQLTQFYPSMHMQLCLVLPHANWSWSCSRPGQRAVPCRVCMCVDTHMPPSPFATTAPVVTRSGPRLPRPSLPSHHPLLTSPRTRRKHKSRGKVPVLSNTSEKVVRSLLHAEALQDVVRLAVPLLAGADQLRRRQVAPPLVHLWVVGVRQGRGRGGGCRRGRGFVSAIPLDAKGE